MGNAEAAMMSSHPFVHVSRLCAEEMACPPSASRHRCDNRSTTFCRGGSGIVAHLGIKLCRTYGDMSKSSGTPRSKIPGTREIV
jgi:hypothetical protein